MNAARSYDSNQSHHNLNNSNSLTVLYTNYQPESKNNLQNAYFGEKVERICFA